MELKFEDIRDWEEKNVMEGKFIKARRRARWWEEETRKLRGRWIGTDQSRSYLRSQYKD